MPIFSSVFMTDSPVGPLPIYRAYLICDPRRARIAQRVCGFVYALVLLLVLGIWPTNLYAETDRNTTTDRAVVSFSDSAKLAGAPTADLFPSRPSTESSSNRQLRELADGFAPAARFAYGPETQADLAATNQIRQVSHTDTNPDHIELTGLSEPARTLVNAPPQDSTSFEGAEQGLTKSEASAEDPLDRPLDSGKPEKKGKLAQPKFSAAVAPVITTLGSLLMVLAAFFFLVVVFKKISPKGNRMLPKDVFEDLGRTCLTPKHQLHLLRLGNRLILVSITPDGVSPITEITNPDEVVPLLGMCRRMDTNSASELFTKTLSKFADDDAKSGYFGVDVQPDSGRKTNKSASKSSLDLYSEPDESLAEILASAMPAKGRI